MAGKVGCLSLQMTLDVQHDAWVAAIKRLGADRPHGFPSLSTRKCAGEINTLSRATRRAFTWWARAVSQKVFTMPAKLLSKSASRLRGMPSIISTWLTLFSRTMGVRTMSKTIGGRTGLEPACTIGTTTNSPCARSTRACAPRRRPRLIRRRLGRQPSRPKKPSVPTHYLSR